MQNNSLSDTKQHYNILDGLRGVAAIIVIWYHVFEAFATCPQDQRCNHGYLAVDFFFILSGFVIGYAYDNRWKQMSIKEFFCRRLIRLHPMIVLGVVFGVISFCIQGCVQWNGTEVSIAMIVVAALLNLLMLPAIPGTGPEIRGNGEMYPLNGPNWSLFFEYIGNILYAFFIRKLSTKKLAVLVACSAVALATFGIGNMSGAGHLGVGWTLAGNNFAGGILRVLFSFSMGLLMSRICKPSKIKGAFWICSILLIALLSCKYVGNVDMPWQNGIYDSVCVIIIFPILVYIGASGKTTNAFSTKICRFLGDISYPLYAIHYPSMYLFYAWIWNNGFTFAETWHIATLIVVGNIILAYIFLKIYDAPVRKWLTRKMQKSERK